MRGLRVQFRLYFLLLAILAMCGVPMTTNARIAISFPPDFTQADIDCFQKDYDAALARIRSTDPVFAEMLDALQSSEIVHFVEYTDGFTDSWGFTDGHQEISWNPAAGPRFPLDGVCVDPIAALLHELYHALANQSGTIDADRQVIDASTNFIKKSEVDATEAENLYRRLNTKCPRVFYGLMELPDPIRVLLCKDARKETCSDIPNGCAKYCCWIYGLIQKNGASYACVKDHLTIGQCNHYIEPGKINAGAYVSPCTFTGVPECP